MKRTTTATTTTAHEDNDNDNDRVGKQDETSSTVFGPTLIPVMEKTNICIHSTKCLPN